MAKSKKPNSKTPKKTTVKSKKASRAPKALRLEQLDQLLLKLMPLEKVRKKFKTGKKRLDDERKFAILLGSQILEKAEDVRTQLVKHYSKKTKK